MKNLTMLTDIANEIETAYCPDAARIDKAQHIVRQNGVSKLPNGNYQVQSETDPNHFYQVNLNSPRCNCYNFTQHVHDMDFHYCKHLIAVMIWEQLPEQKIAPRPMIDILNDLIQEQNLVGVK